MNREQNSKKGDVCPLLQGLAFARAADSAQDMCAYVSRGHVLVSGAHTLVNKNRLDAAHACNVAYMWTLQQLE